MIIWSYQINWRQIIFKLETYFWWILKISAADYMDGCQDIKMVYFLDSLTKLELIERE